MRTSTILVLDDEPAVAGVFAAALEAAGHHVVVCTGYEEARDYIKQHLPSGLITDVRVAEYNGLQLAILFRSLSPSGALMVVSGHDDIVIRREAAQINAAFMSKPVRIAELTAFFSGSGQSGPAPQPTGLPSST